MEPSLAKHLDRLAERRPDVAVMVAHLWELSLTEFAVPLGGIGFPYGKHSGSATTLAVFRTSEPIATDDKRLLRDLSAFDPGWLVDNLATLAASKPWAGGVKRHQWLSWDYLFLDGWCNQPVELTFPARWKPAEVVVPPRLWVVCGDVVKVKPDGWLVELPNVLPKLADLVGSKSQPSGVVDTSGWVLLTPKQLKVALGVSWDTVKRDIERGRMRVEKVTNQRYLVDPRELPRGWERKIK